MMLRANSQRRGTATSEFALLLPFLTFLFLVTLDYGRIFYYAITVDNCMHNGAIFGSQSFDNQNQQWIGNNQYWQGPNGQLISIESAAADVDGGNLSPALGASNVTVSTGTDTNGNSVNIITISYTFTPISTFPWLPSSITLSRTWQARIGQATPS